MQTSAGYLKAQQTLAAREPKVEAQSTITVSVDLHRVVDDAVSALATAREVYQRDGELVRVVHAAEPDDKGGVSAGTPQIKPIELPTAREILTRVASWQRTRKNKDGTYSDEACLPPDHAVSALLKRHEYPEMRPIIGVTEAPCLKPDGTLLLTPGYDVSTGLVYEPTCKVPLIKPEPTQDDAKAAYTQLNDIFQDFPFASDAYRGVPIAAILTMLVRPSFRGAIPMIAIDASTRGSGKSLLSDVISIITTGRSAPKLTYPPDEEELEKTLSSCALFGSRLICLDNISGTLGAAPLDKVLTADDRVQLRVLGKSEVRDVAWRAMLMATGNNLIFGADTPRRTLRCRLEPATERPEERTGFKHLNLLAYVREFRGDFLHAALTILRAFVVAGRPQAQGFTWGSYQTWSEIVAAAIGFAGGPNILDARVVSVDGGSSKDDALRTVLALLPSIAPDGLTCPGFIQMCWPPGERGYVGEAQKGSEGLRDALASLCNVRNAKDTPNNQRLSAVLDTLKGRVAGDRKLDRTRKNKASPWVWFAATTSGAVVTVSSPLNENETSTLFEDPPVSEYARNTPEQF